MKLEKVRVRHRSGHWREKSHTERQHILHVWYSAPGQTTSAQRKPRQARKAHLYRSAPLTHTLLAGISTVKVSIFSIFHLQVASAFQKKPVKRYEARCSKRIYAASERAMWVAAMPEFERPLSEPHFDLSSRCQLAAMFVYSARSATCVITSNEVTCFDLSWKLIPGRDEDVEMGLRLRIWMCESGWGWD